jgi:hypothetical protein
MSETPGNPRGTFTREQIEGMTDEELRHELALTRLSALEIGLEMIGFYAEKIAGVCAAIKGIDETRH